MMPPPRLLTLFLLLALCLCHASVWAQDPANRLDGALVTCGTEKVAVLEGTASKDGRFAAAWTLYAKPGKPPVDWSAYDRKDPAAFANRYKGGPSADWPDDNGYQLVNGLVNLSAKTFTPLPGDTPYFPGEQRCHLDAAWSEDRHGTRYAALTNAVGNRRDETTVDLCLAVVSPGGPRFVDLKPAADRAAREYLHKRDPKDYRKYQWSFDLEDVPGEDKPSVVFRGDVLTIHFNADIPADEKNFDSGRVRFALPTGNVTGTAPDK